mmetsp:Transcript_13909/g.23536  ORF Transcript_13909/g.23536 Transcript_13909/m.23536 type:complete len:215 (+) Transcript_13909:455-1099(+)
MFFHLVLLVLEVLHERLELVDLEQQRVLHLVVDGLAVRPLQPQGVARPRQGQRRHLLRYRLFQFALDLLRLLDLVLHLCKLLLQLLLHPQDALHAHHEGRLQRVVLVARKLGVLLGGSEAYLAKLFRLPPGHLSVLHHVHGLLLPAVWKPCRTVVLHLLYLHVPGDHIDARLVHGQRGSLVIEILGQLVAELFQFPDRVFHLDDFVDEPSIGIL